MPGPPDSLGLLGSRAGLCTSWPPATQTPLHSLSERQRRIMGPEEPHRSLRLWDPATPFSCWTSHLAFSAGELEGPQGPDADAPGLATSQLSARTRQGSPFLGHTSCLSSRVAGTAARTPATPKQPPACNPACSGELPSFLLAVTTSHSHDHQLIGVAKKRKWWSSSPSLCHSYKCRERPEEALKHETDSESVTVMGSAGGCGPGAANCCGPQKTKRDGLSLVRGTGWRSEVGVGSRVWCPGNARGLGGVHGSLVHTN